MYEFIQSIANSNSGCSSCSSSVNIDSGNRREESKPWGQQPHTPFPYPTINTKHTNTNTNTNTNTTINTSSFVSRGNMFRRMHCLN